jgi:uncharacterized protein (TIGR03435 family)
MKLKAMVAMAVLFGAAGWAIGQTAAPAPKLEFEVASIRPTQTAPTDRVNAGLKMDGSQVHVGALSLKNLMVIAYKVQPNMISGPDWLAATRYDISAKLPDGGTTQQIPEMMQSLLAERFGLKIHRETKDTAAYVMVMGKQPLKLKQTPADAAAASPNANGAVNVAASGSAAGVVVDLGNGSSISLANNQFEIKKLTMDRFADQISRYLDRPMVNMTGLTGTYDMTLPVVEQDYYILLVQSGVNAGVMLPPQALRVLDAGAPASLFDALEQQGIHVDSRKVPLDTIVVDSALQAPTEN